MNKPTVILLLLILGLVFWLQYHSELYHIFLGGLGTSYTFAFGMVAKGSHISEEHKLKISQAHKGKHFGGRPFGYHHSEETKRKIGLGNKGKTITPEQRMKISQAHKGKPSWSKGHNYGLCQKCGKEHVHGMTGKHHSTETKEKISKAHEGKFPTSEARLKMSLAKTGKPLSPTHYAHLVEANKSQEKCQKISQKLKGRISPNKGNHYTIAQRLRISESLKRSILWHEALKHRKLKGLKRSPLTRLRIKIAKLKYWANYRRESVGKLYNLPEGIVCYPSSFYDHVFARRVLIEQVEFRPFIEHTGLREIPTFVDENGEVKVIVPVLEEVK